MRRTTQNRRKLTTGARIGRLVVPVLAVLALLVTSAPRTASAHPLGEATISHYSALMVGQDRVEVRYVVDMAEIPAFQELGAIRPDRSTDLTPQERDAFFTRKSAELLANITLTLDGKTIPLEQGETGLTFPPGNGGLPTLRFEMRLAGKLSGATRGTLYYRDGNFQGRKGWKEIIANPLPGTVLVKSDVPTTDQTAALTVYKLDVTTNPPKSFEATVEFAPGDTPAAAGVSTEPGQGDPVAGAGWTQQRGDFFSNILQDKELPIVFALLLAFVAGAGHALSPGHGKTVVAAYLVGTRGTARHAALLGVTVTISHTIGVFFLGVIILSLGQYILPETIAPFLGFASGLLIMIVGLVLFVQRFRHWRASRPADNAHTHDGSTHDHSHDHDHPHDHPHDHSHDHAAVRVPDPSVAHSHGPFSKPHTHLPADGRAVTIGSLLALGITGGIIPCPSALVVLLVAVYTNQVALGLLLIVAFSAGLASVLTGLGLLAVYGRGFLERRRFNSSRFRTGAILGRLPMASAVAVTCLGVVIAFSALSTQ